MRRLWISVNLCFVVCKDDLLGKLNSLTSQMNSVQTDRDQLSRRLEQLQKIIHQVEQGITMTSCVFFSRPRSKGWPHHGRIFSIYLCPLSFWLTLPQGVLSTSWCCLSRPCVVFLACVHLTLVLALSLSPGNSFVSSWCDHSMLVSLLWQCLTVPSSLQLC